MIKVNNKMVKLDKFPDGTFNIKGDPSLCDGTVLISWHYHDDAEFMAVAFLTKYYQARGNEVVLYLPYVPNARMDRIEDAHDIFTMKYFGEMINSLNFAKVFVMDVHSSVAVAVIKNCQILHNEMVNDVIRYIVSMEDGNIPLVFFPDEGAMKRYSKGLRIPFAFGMKKRDWSNGQILGYEVHGVTEEDIKGMNVLIWDDICSKGGTFYHAAKKLKEMGAANIYLMVSHCENNIHKGEFGEEKVNLLATGLVKKVFTTDSIYSLGDSEMVMVGKVGLKCEHEDEAIAIPIPINMDDVMEILMGKKPDAEADEDCDGCECEGECPCCQNCCSDSDEEECEDENNDKCPEEDDINNKNMEDK